MWKTEVREKCPVLKRKKGSFTEAAAYHMGHNPTSNNPGMNDYIFYPPPIHRLLHPSDVGYTQVKG